MNLIIGETYYNAEDTKGYVLKEIIGNYYYFTIFKGSDSSLVVTYVDKLEGLWYSTRQQAYERKCNFLLALASWYKDEMYKFIKITK